MLKRTERKFFRILFLRQTFFLREKKKLRQNTRVLSLSSSLSLHLSLKKKSVSGVLHHAQEKFFSLKIKLCEWPILRTQAKSSETDYLLGKVPVIEEYQVVQYRSTGLNRQELLLTQE